MILDNGSGKDTSDWLVSSGYRYGLLRSDENLGVIEGRNSLLEYVLSNSFFSDAKHFLVLDNDQLPQVGWLSHHISVLDQGYDVIGVEAWKMNKSFFPVEKITDITRPYHYVGCGGMLIRRYVLEEIGMFDSRFSPAYFEDPDFCFRVLSAGYKIGWNAKPKITHISHTTLGQMNGQKREQKFLDSYKKFCYKWHSHKLTCLIQKDLPQFH